MLHIIDRTNREAFSDVVREARLLRHRVFVDELGWEALRRPDGEERDDFDTSDAVEMIYLADGAVTGYQRLLPTTAPHLLSHVYPELSDDVPPSAPDIWEWTRFAVDEKRRAGPAGTAISLSMATALVRWGLENGLSAFVVQVDPVHLLRFVSCHFLLKPLGIPQRIGGADVVAALTYFDTRTLVRLEALENERVRRPLFDGMRR